MDRKTVDMRETEVAENDKPVQESLHEGAHGKDVERRCKDDDIGLHDLVQDHSHVIFDDTFSRCLHMTGITPPALIDVEVFKVKRLSRCPSFPNTFQKGLKNFVRIPPCSPGASVKCQYCFQYVPPSGRLLHRSEGSTVRSEVQYFLCYISISSSSAIVQSSRFRIYPTIREIIKLKA